VGGRIAWELGHESLIDEARFVRPAETLVVTGRDGVPLRHTRPDGYDRRWVSLDDVSPSLVAAVLAAEDARFHRHHGVDWKATARAALQAIVPGTPRSGASTITQQTVKLVYGRPHGRWSKPMEILRAVELEQRMTKDEILEQYLNRVPFGDQIVGVARASEAYFGKPPSELSIGEAALLAGIPQAPSATEPRRHRARAMRRRRTVLTRMRDKGFLDESQLRAALASEPRVLTERRPWRAPRFVDRVLDAHLRDALPDEARVGPREIRTSIDARLQEETREILRRTVSRFSGRGVTNAAAVVLLNDSGEVLSYVGAARSGAEAAGGQLDLLRARRQPGSTLKPFVYGLLFEDGGSAATVLDDVAWAMTGGDGALFEAEDYDGVERGPVRAREALASSLNLAALDAARRVGASRIVARLGAVGIQGLGEAEEYGAAIVLGGADVAPLDLARAYQVIARRGRRVRLRFTPGGYDEGAEVMEPGAVEVLRDVLMDGDARARAFGADLEDVAEGRFGLKTGTSSGWRDAWAAVFDERVTIVVWLGDPGGRALGEVSGFEAAAPAAARILAAARQVGEDASVTAVKPGLGVRLEEARVCALSGAVPHAGCPGVTRERFVRGTEPREPCAFHGAGGELELPARYAGWARTLGLATESVARGVEPLRIVQPRDGARLVVDATRAPAMTLRAVRGRDSAAARWTVDGVAVDGVWVPRAGEHEIAAEVDEERVTVRVSVESAR